MITGPSPDQEQLGRLSVGPSVAQGPTDTSSGPTHPQEASVATHRRAIAKLSQASLVACSISLLTSSNGERTIHKSAQASPRARARTDAQPRQRRNDDALWHKLPQRCGR
eukprot:3938796-Alexandrium_andersonii.AAC.1